LQKAKAFAYRVVKEDQRWRKSFALTGEFALKVQKSKGEKFQARYFRYVFPLEEGSFRDFL